jgi:hypothetical protein
MKTTITITDRKTGTSVLWQRGRRKIFNTINPLQASFFRTMLAMVFNQPTIEVQAKVARVRDQ